MRTYRDWTDRVDQLCAAVCRIAVRDGLPAVTIRALAAEAGISVSAIRHWDPHHDRIRATALRAVVDRRRTPYGQAIFRDREQVPGAEALIRLLPSNAHERHDHQVWLAYASAARVEPALRAVVATADRELRDVVARILEADLDGPEREPKLLLARALLTGLSSMICHLDDPIDLDEAAAVIRLALAT